MSERILSSPHKIEAIDQSEFTALMEKYYGLTKKCHLVVGVSGGADSLALCLLADEWGKKYDVQITAITVNHGLRKEAEAEAQQVNFWLRYRGIRHHVIRINELQPVNGLQAIARRWRFSALDSWCRENSANAVLLAHTIEDQAETICMRVLADTGPEGLSGMRHCTRVAGLTVIRPLLEFSKVRLIATLTRFDQKWLEDPSNDDTQFTRVKLRKLEGALQMVGLDKHELSRLSIGMGKLRDIFDHFAHDFMSQNGGVFDVGVSWMKAVKLDNLPDQFAELLITRLLLALGGGQFPPRKHKVRNLRAALRRNKTMTITLGGCIIEKSSDGIIWIYREYLRNALPVLVAPQRVVRWDNRFEICQNLEEDLLVGPLGHDGWCKIRQEIKMIKPDILMDNLPFRARLSIPVARSLDGTVLIPHFGRGKEKQMVTRCTGLSCIFLPDSGWMSDLVIEQGETRKSC